MKPLWLIGIVLVLTGCRHKELWMGGEHFATIEVAFDWDGVRTRASEEEALSMSLYLYPESGSAPLYYELSGHAGGRIRVPFGRYAAVAWNHENDAILLRGQGSRQTAFWPPMLSGLERQAKARAKQKMAMKMLIMPFCA